MPTIDSISTTETGIRGTPEMEASLGYKQTTPLGVTKQRQGTCSAGKRAATEDIIVPVSQLLSQPL